MGSHKELPIENNKNLYLLTKFFDGTLTQTHIDGFDTRYDINEQPTVEVLSFYLLKGHLIQLMNDNYTNIHTKTQIIHDFNFLLEMDTLSPSIISDDLLDDWNFEI